MNKCSAFRAEDAVLFREFTLLKDQFISKVLDSLELIRLRD